MYDYDDEKEKARYKALQWRSIGEDWGDVVCTQCAGSGVKVYNSTAIWRGGCGGSAMTEAVCDKCWGSGKSNAPWADLRKIDELITRLRREVEEAKSAN